ncbi:MAG: ribbon-helix-helix domain-containing protein [Actinomycetia bacterium]|nr:ribbon-helix-helix domain-containing protein [Actinomycetes bacterium]
MARVQTIVQLNSEILEALDQEAAETDISRSAIIRQAIMDHIASSKAAQIDHALAEGYKAIPQKATEEWNSLLEQSRENTRRTLERLDAEEDAAGLTW